MKLPISSDPRTFEAVSKTEGGLSEEAVEELLKVSLRTVSVQ